MVTKKINDIDTQPASCDSDSCAVREALLIIGGKWKNTIMHNLGNHNFLRFNHLKSLIPDISQKMLTQQLRELERDGLVKREAFSEIPPRVQYSITKLGKTTGSVYKNINQWQQKYMQTILKCRDDYDTSL